MTGFALKLIALFCMFIDHIGYMLAAYTPYYLLMRCIGRIAFPLYAFFIAEGCCHTKNMKKYMLRLGLFAFISELPFNLCFFNRSFYPNYQNIFFTLLLAVAAIYTYEKIKQAGYLYWSILPVVAAMLLAYLLKTDYAHMGVLTIFLIYLGKSKSKQALGMTIGIILINLSYFQSMNISIVFILFALIAVGLTLSYNGRPGPKLKYFFYWAYPLHILALWFLFTFAELFP